MSDIHFAQTVLSRPQGKMCVTNYATAHFTHCQSFYIPILFPAFQQILLPRPVDLSLHVKFSSMVYLRVLTTYEQTLFDALWFHTLRTLQFYDVIFWSKNQDLKVCNTIVISLFSLPKCKLFRISGVPKVFGGLNPPPPPKFRSFDKVEPDYKLRGKYLVVVF